MSYPPGMIREDWKHIDGESHYRQCPESEEYVHDCCKLAIKYLRPEFNPPCWVLVVHTGLMQYEYIRVDYCPWCGEDLGSLGCICPEIRAQGQEESDAAKG